MEISIAEEEFATSGDIVLDRGWLDVYPYSNWVNDPLPPFRNHEVVAFSLLEMAESRTQAPPLLSEADLISLMDREKIGTDATMHDHIQKIQTRTYAVKNADGRLEPSRLGLALVQGYQRFAAEEGMDLSKPILRARMERGMEAVAAGRQRKEDFLREALDIAQRCYAALERNAPALDQTLGQHFSSQLDVGRRAQVVQAAFSMCRCGASMELRRHIPGGPPGGGGAVGRGRARGRGRAGRAGRGRGRGRAMVRGRGPVQRGRAAVARQELFLVCPNGACGVVLRLSLRSDQTPTAYGHMCPICDFQVLNIKNEETQRNHQLCPHCFNYVPQDLHPGQTELRCFQCVHPSCLLAAEAVSPFRASVTPALRSWLHDTTGLRLTFGSGSQVADLQQDVELQLELEADGCLKFDELFDQSVSCV